MTDITLSCHKCRRELEEFESFHFVKGWPTCTECTEMCDLCGEWLDDDDQNPTPYVRYRRYEVDGKLSRPTHADCAGDWLLSLFADKAGLIGAEDLTRDQIAALVESQIGVVA